MRASCRFKRNEQSLTVDRLKKIIILSTSIIGISVIWLGMKVEVLSNPVTIVAVPALLGGTTGCGAWCLGVAWADRRNLPNSLRMNGALFCALIVSGIILLTAGSAGLLLEILRMTLKHFTHPVGAALAAIVVKPVFNRRRATSYLPFSKLNCRNKHARDPNALRHPIAAKAAPTK